MVSVLCDTWLSLLWVARQVAAQPAHPPSALSPLHITIRLIIAAGILAIVCIVGWRVIPSAFRPTRPTSPEDDTDNAHSES